MRGHGVNVAPIIHPAVHEDDARLRFFVNATHTADQIHTTIDALRAELDHLAR
jgi:7-keto-8-aminopelargonate synthetase-like enzyme